VQLASVENGFLTLHDDSSYLMRVPKPIPHELWRGAA
jgi:hypothetical protein